MRKKIAILLILNFLISFFSVINNVEGAVAASLGCCKKSGDRYCEPASSSAGCDDFTPVSCESLSECTNNIICLISSDGKCYDGFSKYKCQDQDGSIQQNRNAGSPCEKGACLIGSQCPETTKAECNIIGKGIRFEFKGGYSQEQCLEEFVFNREMGCCVIDASKGDCSTTTRANCNGQFNTNLCNTISECGGCSEKPNEKKCGPTGKGGEDVFEFDGCGVMIKKSDDCNVADGKICGVDPDKGVASCVRKDCVEGDEVFSMFNNPSGLPGMEEPVKIILTKEMLGGERSYMANKIKDGNVYRQHGESWCMLDLPNENSGAKIINIGKEKDDEATPRVHEKYSYGTRYLKYICMNGRIYVDACADFRGQVCKSNMLREGEYTYIAKQNRLEKVEINTEIQDEFESARCVENNWNVCNPSKGKCPDEGDCVLDTTYKNECWPKYPPGYAFWDLENNIKISGNKLGCSKDDGGCGTGKLNSCDDDECWHMGDCDYKEGWEWWQGALLGAAVGFVTGISLWALWGVITAPAGAGAGEGIGTAAGPYSIGGVEATEAVSAAGTAVKTTGTVATIGKGMKAARDIGATALTLYNVASLVRSGPSDNSPAVTSENPVIDANNNKITLTENDIIAYYPDTNYVEIWYQGERAFISCEGEGVTLLNDKNEVIC